MELEQLAELSKTILNTHVSAWLPCSLKVDPWPFPNSVQNEYYVPRDANSHYYFQCGWSRVKSEAERDDWENGELGQVRWKVPTQEDFTRQDAEAREGIAKFYDQEGGWDQEQPAMFDIELLMWRVFAGENARGIQKHEHTLGHFKR